jgi:uncharacterized metal-binding protein
MSDTNCNCAQKIMMITCSGGSNLGQLSNQAAVELTKEGFGEIFCLAGIGADMSGFVQSAKEVKEMVLIDGCDKACGKAILENAGVVLKKHVVVTQLNIGKNDNFTLNPDDIAVVKIAVKLEFKYPIKFYFDSPKPLSPGDKARSKMLGGRCC